MNRIFFLLIFVFNIFTYSNAQKIYSFNNTQTDTEWEVVVDTLGIYKIALVFPKNTIDKSEVYINLVLMNSIVYLEKWKNDTLKVFSGHIKVEIYDLNLENRSIKFSACENFHQNNDINKLPFYLSDLNHGEKIKSLTNDSLEFAIVSFWYYKIENDILEDFMNLSQYAKTYGVNIYIFINLQKVNPDICTTLCKHSILLPYDRQLEHELMVNSWPSYILLRKRDNKILYNGSLDNCFKILAKR